MVSALSVAACGNETNDAGDDDDAGTTAPDGGAGTDDPFADLERVAAPDPCTNDPGISDGEIKVGLVVPKSGARATSFADSETGVRARIEAANANGEVGDREISLTVVDDASDATRNGEVVRQLVESENVFAVVSVSDQAPGSAEYLDEQGVPVVGWHVGAPEWDIHENMFPFRLGAGDDPEGEYNTRGAELVRELGGTKVAVIGGGNQASATFVDKNVALFEASEGLEVVYSTTDVVSGDTNFTAVVQRIKEAGADTVLTGMDFLQNTALSKQLSDAGVEIKAMIFPGGYDTRVLGIEGVEEAVFGLEFIPFEIETPAYEAFDAAMPADAPRNQITYIGWLSGELLVQGIKEAGVACPTREAFITNLRLIDDYTANGAFDPVNFRDLWGEPFPCAYYVQVRDGGFEPLFDGEAFCGEHFEIP
jgi:ABC-type branched-subunit amino acid transport system substrate-binding protein